MKKIVRYGIISALALSASVIAFNALTEREHAVPLQYTYLNGIGGALYKYAQKHKGLYPVGKSSTEVFQQLIDDGDATSRIFWFELPGKKITLSNKLSPENVCFDFTEGATEKSPDWLPIVIPTGYLINYKTGEAIRLPSYAITDDYINVAFLPKVRTFPVIAHNLYFFKQPNININIMPGKPAKVNVEQYHQLTPNGSLP